MSYNEQCKRAAQLYSDLEEIIAAGKGDDKCTTGIAEAYNSLVGIATSVNSLYPPSYNQMLVKVGQYKAKLDSYRTTWEGLMG